jgi:hypothetical protein
MTKKIFLISAIVAIALFALSMYVGYSLENDTYNKLNDKLTDMQDATENAMLFSMFLETHTNNTALCGTIKGQLDIAAQDTYNIYGSLEESKSVSIFKGYEQLRRKYFLANMRFYLMLREYQMQCEDTTLKPILFFYSTYNECPECVAQGKVLDTVRSECKNARVYAFPADSGDVPIISAFKSYYGISKTPSLIIGEEKLEALITKDEVKTKISCN